MREKGRGIQKKSNIGSFRSIFMHADGYDMLLMGLGFLGALGDGLSTPAIMLVMSKLINSIGGSSLFTIDNLSQIVNKVLYLYLYFLKCTYMCSQTSSHIT